MFVCLSVCLSVNFFSVKDFSATTFIFSLLYNIYGLKDFSATTWVMILKFGTKLDSDQLYCVTKEQPDIAYQSLNLFIFLSLQWKFLSQISQLLLCHCFQILCTSSGKQSVLCKLKLRC